MHTARVPWSTHGLPGYSSVGSSTSLEAMKVEGEQKVEHVRQSTLHVADSVSNPLPHAVPQKLQTHSQESAWTTAGYGGKNKPQPEVNASPSHLCFNHTGKKLGNVKHPPNSGRPTQLLSRTATMVCGPVLGAHDMELGEILKILVVREVALWWSTCLAYVKS